MVRFNLRRRRAGRIGIDHVRRGLALAEPFAAEAERIYDALGNDDREAAELAVSVERQSTHAIRTHSYQAGIAPWPRLWQNLRASRATKLADLFPGHACAAWRDHTDAVAELHDFGVTPAHLATAIRGTTDDAVGEATARGEKTPTQIPKQMPPEMPRKRKNCVITESQKGLVLISIAAPCKNLARGGMGATGFEQLQKPRKICRY